MMEYLGFKWLYWWIPDPDFCFISPQGFFEERALLLGRLGRHEQALAVYAHILKDTRQAEEYCRRTALISKESETAVSTVSMLHLLHRSLNPAVLRRVEALSKACDSNESRNMNLI